MGGPWAIAAAVGLAILAAAPLGWIMFLGSDLDLNQVRQAKAAVRAKLSDPGAARFQNMKVYKQWDATSQMTFKRVCGEVNAKNRVGGYVGYRRFVLMGTSVVLMEPISEASDGPWFGDLWASFCVNKPRRAR